MLRPVTLPTTTGTAYNFTAGNGSRLLGVELKSGCQQPGKVRQVQSFHPGQAGRSGKLDRLPPETQRWRASLFATATKILATKGPLIVPWRLDCLPIAAVVALGTKKLKRLVILCKGKAHTEVNIGTYIPWVSPVLRIPPFPTGGLSSRLLRLRPVPVPVCRRPGPGSRHTGTLLVLWFGPPNKRESHCIWGLRNKCLEWVGNSLNISSHPPRTPVAYCATTHCFPPPRRYGYWMLYSVSCISFFFFCFCCCAA